MVSTALLIDTSNVYHCIKTQYGLEVLDYQDVFDALSRRYDLVEIHFYDAIKNRRLEPVKYSNQQIFHERMKALKPGVVRVHTTKLRYRQNISSQQVDIAAKDVGIVDSCLHELWRLLEKLDVIVRQEEKGVDVMLASDAIEIGLSKRCECIIIFSGDADFVPAVKLIQRYGGEVVNLHVSEGSSDELKHTCRRHIHTRFEAGGTIHLAQRDNQTGNWTTI